MSAFAYVGQEDKLRRYVEIFIGNEAPDGYSVLVPEGGNYSYYFQANNDSRPYGQVPTQVPTIQLRIDQAKALLEALLVYFGGSEDARQLRKDLDTERARLDKLLAKLPIVVDAR